MLCLKCGHINPKGAKVCQKCGVPLPDRSTPPPPINVHLEELRKKVDMVKNRQISSGEFRNFLNKLDALFEKTLKEIEDMEIPEDIKLEMAQEMSEGISGINLYREALQQMHRFLDTRDPSYLDKGLAMAIEANRRINLALKLNYENFRSVQETAEEFLTQQGLV